MNRLVSVVIVMLLCGLSVSLEASSEEAFFRAVKQGNVAKVRALLKAGVNVNAKYKGDWGKKSRSPEAYANPYAIGGLFDWLFPFERWDRRRTALMLAAEAGHSEVVQALLEAGADVEARDIDGWTAFFIAAHSGHTKVMQVFLEAGANLNEQFHGGNALFLAAAQGHVDTVKALLKAGLNVNATHEDTHNTVLIEIMYNQADQAKMVRVLLEAGADPNLITKGDIYYPATTALISAVQLGHTDSVRTLIKAGAKVNLSTPDGRTALKVATQRGFGKIARLLREAGATE